MGAESGRKCKGQGEFGDANGRLWREGSGRGRTWDCLMDVDHALGGYPGGLPS